MAPPVCRGVGGFAWCSVHLLHLLARYLGEVRLLTTSCCITELEQLNCYGAMMVAKGFPVFK